MLKYIVPLGLFCACTSPTPENKGQEHAEAHTDSVAKHAKAADTLVETVKVAPVNDTLNAMAELIAGTWKDGRIYSKVGTSSSYTAFAGNFSKRWQRYDSTRIATLVNFRNTELNEKVAVKNTLFYPFSGPDILYPTVFFPSAKKYIMVGLEPVGTFPDFSSPGKDTLDNYYSKLNSSLYAILQFSFFRTQSMSKDLKSGELDGVMHVLFLFLNRTGNAIVSAKPMSIDTNGNKIYYNSFEELAKQKLKTRGLEVFFNNKQGELKELNYFSLDASNYELQHNKGFTRYMQKENDMNAYLKGASYLLHRPYFSIIRDIILQQAETVVQDDSGISLKYFLNDSGNWSYTLYGEYTKPIPKFAKQYQPLLDSLYESQGAKKLDFGIGYNFKDKNSNFMIATKRKAKA